MNGPVPADGVAESVPARGPRRAPANQPCGGRLTVTGASHPAWLRHARPHPWVKDVVARRAGVNASAVREQTVNKSDNDRGRGNCPGLVFQHISAVFSVRPA
jgi:hypothetical protein